jgi:hypothetical protein
MVGLRRAGRAPCALQRGGRASFRLGMRLHARARTAALLPVRGHGARTVPDRGRARRSPPRNAHRQRRPARSPQAAARRSNGTRPRFPAHRLVAARMPAPLSGGPLPHLRLTPLRVPHLLLPDRGRSRGAAIAHPARRRRVDRPADRRPLRALRAARPAPTTAHSGAGRDRVRPRSAGSGVALIFARAAGFVFPTAFDWL